MTDQIDVAPTDELDTFMATGQEAETQPSGDDAAAAAEQPEPQDEPAPEPPKKPSAQDRIDELTRLRREAERRAEAAEAALAATRKQDAPAQPADGEPNPDDFQFGETDAGYIRALARYEAKQEFQQQAQQHAAQEQARSLEQTWEQRQTAFAQDKADYAEVLAREWPCTPVMADAIKTSEDGPAVAYHLANNPDEARRIAALHPISQVRELGRIEARLSAPAAPATSPTKTVSDAPAPAPQARGLSGRFVAPDDTDDLEAFESKFFGRG